ncbi:MAG: outer membrane lipoprotein chaperone LolA, partial [Oceanobacter sp.]
QIELQRTEGHMVVAHPGKLRWQTRPPYEQLVISDGELLWVYDMDLDQVTLRNLGRSYKNTPALLLSGDKAEIERNYRVNRIASGTQQELYELTPLDQSQLFTQLEFTYNGDNLTEMRILDATGQQTRIEFSNLLLNQSLDSYAFVFDVPEGADVIDARNGF